MIHLKNPAFKFTTPNGKLSIIKTFNLNFLFNFLFNFDNEKFLLVDYFQLMQDSHLSDSVGGYKAPLLKD